MNHQPAYVRIAGEIARRIRTGELAAGTQLSSRAELAAAHGVSDIVIRQAINLLRSQGLVRTVERRGMFVADQPTLVRVSPERQLESPEASFGNESGEAQVDREERTIPAPDDLAEMLGLEPGAEVTHVVTRVTVDGRPISISDSYAPTVRAKRRAGKAERVLEETLTIAPPTEGHREFLGIASGEAAATIHQRFQTGDQTDMVTDITYPTDRYASFVFRMQLPTAEDEA